MNPPENPAEFAHKIEHDRNFTPLGAGAFATVYGHREDPTYAIKVGKTKTDGYLAYLKMVMEDHEDNQFSPRIYWLRVFDTGYIVKMERLDKCIGHISQNSDTYKLWSKAQDYANGGKDPGLPPDLVRLLQSLRKQKKHRVDFHCWNSMISKDGRRLVITDPLSYPKED